MWEDLRPRDSNHIPQSSSVEQVIADSTRIAELFVPKYYASLDKAPGPERTPFSFYSPESRIAWNGNPIPFADLPLFIERMPHSNHAVQAFDCHPIPGSAAGAGPPSLMITVTGQVTHGDHLAHPPVGTNHSKTFDLLPRTFSQTFILVFAIREPPNQDIPYLISADAYRFV